MVHARGCTEIACGKRAVLYCINLYICPGCGGTSTRRRAPLRHLRHLHSARPSCRCVQFSFRDTFTAVLTLYCRCRVVAVALLFRCRRADGVAQTGAGIDAYVYYVFVSSCCRFGVPMHRHMSIHVSPYMELSRICGSCHVNCRCRFRRPLDFGLERLSGERAGYALRCCTHPEAEADITSIRCSKHNGSHLTRTRNGCARRTPLIGIIGRSIQATTTPRGSVHFLPTPTCASMLMLTLVV
jgi:hypothetical protein